MRQGRGEKSGHFALTKADLDVIGATDEKGSLVDRIFLLVVHQIQARQLAAGTRVASVRQLASVCEVSRDTVSRAYDKLVAHGHLDSRRGSGFYVKVATRQSRAGAPLESVRAHSQVPSNWRYRLLRSDAELQSNTSSGQLPDAWIDEPMLSAAMRAVARGNQRSLAKYEDPLGYPPLRQQLQTKLQELGIQADPRQIMMTSGATEAIHFVTQSYLRQVSEVVLVEDPSPFMLTERLMASGLEFAEVPRRSDGPDIDLLRQLCEKHRPRFFYCSSVLHNPTCSNLSPHKAFQILQLAEEFDLTIVEDDTYCDLMPTSGPGQITRLATLDQLKRVIYIGSFSKTLGPGLRVGFLVANPERTEWLTMYKIADRIASSSLSERIVYRILSQGGYRHHCEQIRGRLDDVRHRVVEQLTEFGLGIDSVPNAGMYVWASLPRKVDAFPVANRLLEIGHQTAPGRLFSPHDHVRSHMRFNVGTTLDSPVLPALAKLLGHQGRGPQKGRP